MVTLSQTGEWVGTPRRLKLTKTDSPPEWMTIEEVADHLKLSRSKLYDMAQNGEIPCSKAWTLTRTDPVLLA